LKSEEEEDKGYDISYPCKGKRPIDKRQMPYGYGRIFFDMLGDANHFGYTKSTVPRAARFQTPEEDILPKGSIQGLY